MAPLYKSGEMPKKIKLGTNIFGQFDSSQSETSKTRENDMTRKSIKYQRKNYLSLICILVIRIHRTFTQTHFKFCFECKLINSFLEI